MARGSQLSPQEHSHDCVGGATEIRQACLSLPLKKKCVYVGEGVACAHAHACEGQSQS